MGPTLTRRRFLEAGAAVAAAAQQPGPESYRTFWGDLHNHNNIGYAQGSLRRTFEIARNHLDFFAFTPHAWWHDISHYEGNIEHKWLNGFAVTRHRWPEVLRLIREFDSPGRFVCIPGYEWHSSNLGDYHVLFPTLEAELFTPDTLPELQEFARRRGCLMIPHHPALRAGGRGANFAHLDPRVSPVLEIYSEWGNAEGDRAPFPYVRHTEPGRWTKNTLQYLLAQGHRVGVVASTDDHLGYPGAYREGMVAVRAAALTREAIFEALRARRTYAVTGDRIALDFTLNRRLMGQEVPYTRERELGVEVTGWAQVDRVEVLKNNRVIHRDFPMDREPSARSWEQPVLVCFEFGWGPWPALGITRVCDWDFHIEVEGGVLEAHQTCFQSGPLEEDRRDRLLERTERGLRVVSFTALRQIIDDVSTKGVVLRLRGGPDTRLSLRLTRPVELSKSWTFRELAQSSEVLSTGPFPKESAIVHRLVFQEHYRSSFRVSDQDAGRGVSWYYVRVVQSNGQLAWSSPIWVEPAAV